MSEKIVQLNEEIIKGQPKELVRGSVEETLNELLEKEAESLPRTNSLIWPYYNKFWLEAQHPAGLLSISCLSYNASYVFFYAIFNLRKLLYIITLSTFIPCGLLSAYVTLESLALAVVPKNHPYFDKKSKYG